MKWRIAYKKVVSLQNILGKDPTNICKKAILEEFPNIIHELEMPDIMGKSVPKSEIKKTFQK